MKGDASSERVREAALSQRGAAGAAARGRGRRRPRQAALALPSPGRSSRRAGRCGSGWRRRAGARGCPHGGRCAPLPQCPGGRERSVGFRRTCNEWQDDRAPCVAN